MTRQPFRPDGPDTIPPLSDKGDLPSPSKPRQNTGAQSALIAGIACHETQKILANLGLDDVHTRADIASLRAMLVTLRRLRFGLMQSILGSVVQGVLLLAAIGLLLLAGG